jgi:hypothetical protein
MYADDSYAFAGCTALTSISVKGIRIFGNHAFDGCTALETVTFSASTDASDDRKFNLMGDYVFANCTSLKAADMSGMYGVSFTFTAWDGKDYAVTDGYFANFGSHVFENCTALETAAFPNSNLGRIGTHIFNGCTSLTSITNLKASTGSSTGATGYFEAGARPFYGIPKTCSVIINMDFPDITNTSVGLFVTTSDEGVVSVNRDWIQDLDDLVECRFNYTYYFNCELDGNGQVAKLHYDDLHSHNQGCEECAYLRFAARDAEMKTYLALGPGEKAENVTMNYLMVAEITKPYDPETQTVSYIAYWAQSGYYSTPIVCNNVVGSAGASMKTGMRTQVVGNIILVDGVLHYEEGATLKACAALNTTSGRYCAGVQLQMIEIPEVYTEEVRIALPSTYSLEAFYDIRGDWDGYFWSSNNEDCIRFEEEYNEDGILVTYMVVTPQATEQQVTVEVAVAFWGQTYYFRRINVTVAAKT